MNKLIYKCFGNCSLKSSKYYKYYLIPTIVGARIPLLDIDFDVPNHRFVDDGVVSLERLIALDREYNRKDPLRKGEFIVGLCYKTNKVNPDGSQTTEFHTAYTEELETPDNMFIRGHEYTHVVINGGLIDGEMIQRLEKKIFRDHGSKVLLRCINHEIACDIGGLYAVIKSGFDPNRIHSLLRHAKSFKPAVGIYLNSSNGFLTQEQRQKKRYIQQLQKLYDSLGG